MSVHLQFDISNISQPLHQRCSELATDGALAFSQNCCLKLLDFLWLLSLGDIPNLVFDVFCSLKINRKWSFQLVFFKYFLIVAYNSVHTHCKNQYPENRQNSESCNQLVSFEIDVYRSIRIGFEQTWSQILIFSVFY